MQHTLGSSLKSQQHITIVVELATLDKGRDVSSQFLDLQPGDIFSKIFSVCANITNGASSTTTFGVGTPVSLLLSRSLQVRSKPALWILNHHFADFT